MLLSMTGHGEARVQQDGLAVTIELRTVNNRYFKLVVRSSDNYGVLESRIESTVREHVRRGTLTVGLRVDRAASPDDYQLNEGVIAGYLRQLERLYDQLHVTDSVRLDQLLTLPGVVKDRLDVSTEVEREWPIIQRALTDALKNLDQMRRQEGAAMAADLQTNCRTIATELVKVEARVPQVVIAYRNRLTERLNNLLADYQVRVEAADVVREIGLFAERSDISEEIVRLKSHLEQFDKIMDQPESNGRKLEFLTQEMFREANTIGSKANDAEIAQYVIEIKTAIERMREMIQNVE